MVKKVETNYSAPGEGGTPLFCPRGGGRYSHTCMLAIRVCAAGKGMVFKPFGLLKGMVFN